MSTKIKGHRISDGAIKLNHFDSTVKIPEAKLDLKHPTHSNAADLTLAQKLTMTMGGNADSLHYHTGGGGGAQGIYTNQERDAQLLKLSMMVQSNLFGLDKAVRDTFVDDSSIDTGVSIANAPALRTLTDDPSYPGSLRPNSEYSYGVSYKTRYGQTNVMRVSSARTGSGYTNAMGVSVVDVPDNNMGMSVYRTNGTTERLLVDDDSDKFDNPHNIQIEKYTSDKTAGLMSTSFTYYSSTSSYTTYTDNQLVAVPNVSLPLTDPVPVDVPFDFYLMTSNRESAYGLEILWDTIPSYAPRDYEVYYTRDTQIKNFEQANWLKFEQLEPMCAAYKERACFSTDGDVIGAYRITNNTRPDNKFNINGTEGITYIRIRVTKIDNLCRLRKVNLVRTKISTARPFYLDLASEDLTPYNTLKFDYKTTGYQIPFQVEAQRSDETVTPYNACNYDLYNGTFSEYRDAYVISNAYINNQPNIRDYNRVRIMIKIAANSDFRAEDFHLRLRSNYISGNNNSVGQNVYPELVVPITFNGKSYIESFDPSIKEIWSDWVHLPYKDATPQQAELAFKQIRGVMWYYQYGNDQTCITTTNAYKFQGNLDKSTAIPTVDTWRDDTRLFKMQYGKTNSVSTNLSNSMTHNVWHKAYLDVGSINALKYLKFFTGSSTIGQGNIILDNFMITKNENLLNGRTSVTHSITAGGTVTEVTSDQFGLSKDKQVYFNQYATVVNPQVIMFDFSVEQTINQINFTCRDRAKAPKNYLFQFSTDPTAVVNDSISSVKWLNFTGVTIGENSFDVGFNGVIQESQIVNNNVSNTTLAHRFHPAQVKKVRILITGTIGGDIPLINNISIFSAVDSSDMKLIFDIDQNIPTSDYYLIDDGITEKDIVAPSVNTTGSSNVIWIKDKGSVELIDRDSSGIIYTKPIDTGMFQSLMLTAQSIGDVTFEVSFDRGTTFVPMNLDEVYQLAAQSDSVIIKANLNDSTASLHAFAMLYSL